jgi:uncharacterized membrane protein (UPF0127 family)
MYRQYLEKNSGMLFIFPEERSQSFWMKNTVLPLDMLFISSELVIVDIATMQPCSVDPCPSYTSKQPAQYCLEVNAGYVRSHKIKIGDTISSEEGMAPRIVEDCLRKIKLKALKKQMEGLKKKIKEAEAKGDEALLHSLFLSMKALGSQLYTLQREGLKDAS